MKIITISSKAHSGVTSVFVHLGKVIDTTHYFVEELPPTIKGDLIVLGAWHDKYNSIIPKIKGKKAILWTSSVWQMESTPKEVEISIFNQLVNAVGKGIDYLFIGDRDLAKRFENENILWFPYPLAYKEHKLNMTDKNNFGLFTVEHFRKNRLNQVLAIQEAHKRNPTIHLTTNCYKEPSPFIDYVGWMSEEVYGEVLQNISFGLNVFPCESFAYSWSELMMRGIPTLCSKRIANNFNLSRFLREYLEIKDPDSCIEISKKILLLCSLSDIARSELSSLCKNHIKSFSQQRNEETKEFLSQFNNHPDKEQKSRAESPSQTP